MDTADLFDLDAVSTSCPFDSTASFISNPPSPPLRNLSHLALWLSPRPSPLCIFDDIPGEISGHFDSEKRDDNFQKEKIKPDPIPSINEVSYNSYVMKEKLMQALRYFKEWTDQRVLVQVWAPVRNEDRYVLTTSDQPFVLDPHASGLLQYRAVSSMYMFSVDEDNDGSIGLPGRVFKQKLPEWTPNVQYYSSKEYPRLSHALLYNVRGSLDLPVFEPSRQSCVAVIELIMTSEMVNYAPEVDKVCRALEAVNLRSSEILEHRSNKLCDEGRRAALAEILAVITVVCEAQKLLLAQTWVPCRHGSSESFSVSNGSCMGKVCLSTSDAAFYVVDAHMWGFRDACSEHHLQNGQGVVGTAFSAQLSCFCSDITKFCKTEYPLVHYAQMFGLSSCLALCFRSSHSEDDVFVVEFFLPLACNGLTKQHALLESISTLVKQNFVSLKVITGAEVGLPVQMIDMITSEDHELKSIQSELPIEDFDEHESKGNEDHNTPEQNLVSCVYSGKNTTRSEDRSVTSLAIISNKLAGRKRGKAEKIISLEDLQKYFSGSLKDAAKNLGVCPTTMKRICRQHGISRWPSRKINKVNRSISKLKLVIESFQGSEVSPNLNPLACPLPVGAGSVFVPARLDGDSVARAEDTSHFKTSEVDDPHHKLAAFSSKTRCSDDDVVKTSISQSSNDGSQGNELCGIEQPFSSNLKQFASTNNFVEDQTTVHLLSANNIIVEDSASSKLVRNPPSASIQEWKAVIIKACYNEDIIRFRLANDAGIAALNEEISKRLMLVMGSFDVKYLDDDHDWVKLSCDEDLEECFEISAMLGSSVIRLSVQDICTHHGCSCQSSGICAV